MSLSESGTIAVVAEKPSVARDIAKVLGATTRGEGYLHGNGYLVTWPLGILHRYWQRLAPPGLPLRMNLMWLRVADKIRAPSPGPRKKCTRVVQTTGNPSYNAGG
jgi:DNA topoisomerase IA